jgi:predicted DNA-binding transcriptional regulator AlpA
MEARVLEGYMPETELAVQLGKSLRTLWRWRVRGVGPPYVVVGRVVMYRISSVRQWLEDRERQPHHRDRRRRK